jgi:hypothetical protein
MKVRMLVLLVSLACWLTPATSAWAASKEDEETARQEARLEGYATSVHVPSGGGSGMAWAMVCGVSVIAVVCLFKNARRTHLD